jgi:iron complex outermembrane recepter protein
VKAFNRDSSITVGREDSGDAWDAVRAGTRMNAPLSTRDTLTVDAGLYSGDAGLDLRVPVLSPPYQERRRKEVDFYGGHVLSRWQRSYSETSESDLQVYFDHASRDDLVVQSVNTVDVEFNHRSEPFESQRLVWGVKYRGIHDDLARAIGADVFDPSRTVHLFTPLRSGRDRAARRDRPHPRDQGRAQRLYRTRGTTHCPCDRKTERTSICLISRAVRTPSRADDDWVLDAAVLPYGEFPVIGRLYGDMSFKSESLLAFEAGYRNRISKNFMLDVAVLRMNYDRIETFDLSSPTFGGFDPVPHFEIPVTAANKKDQLAKGIELTLDWQYSKAWRLQGGYTFLDFEAELDPDSRDPSPFEVKEVEHKGLMRSLLNFAIDYEFDMILRYVDTVSEASGVNSYLELDVRFGYQVTKDLDLPLVVQNALREEHPEFLSDLPSFTRTQVERGVYAKAEWRFS